jgi:hypothetical protein
MEGGGGGGVLKAHVDKQREAPAFVNIHSLSNIERTVRLVTGHCSARSVLYIHVTMSAFSAD